MSSRRATPNTPFIPPLSSPNLSPHPSPSGGHAGGSPNWTVPPSTSGGYPVYPAASPYVNTTPFVPQISPMLSPGVIPNLPPQQQAQRPAHSSRVSEDYTGYPAGVPPMFSPMASAGPHPSPMMPPNGNPYGHWPGYHPTSAPASYAGFATPWTQPGVPLPPTATPWGMPPGLPPQAGGFTPYGPQPALPPQGGPAPAGWPGMQPSYSADPWSSSFPTRPAARPEPPAAVNDRMDRFAEGSHYGPVLEPFLVKVCKAVLKINPLIQVYDENSGEDAAHLKWNMLYPTSTVQRSTDPTHVSWYKGRDEPATFPRVSSLRVVSEITPWVIEVRASERERGVTCGDVIEAIGYDFNKRTLKEDFQIYSGPEQRELTNAYHWNRSRNPGAPGGQLGNGMKRLDFLRSRTIYGGLESNERAVKRICGEVLPATFVLKCVPAMASSEREQQERELRMKAGVRSGRSRANSTNTRITVEPPSTIDDDDD